MPVKKAAPKEKTGPAKADHPTKAAPARRRMVTPLPQRAESSSQPIQAIVGMVASAGGLAAFKQFFLALPADSGMAFVLIPHLDPKHESLMAPLLGKHTTMPVMEAKDGQPLAANHVYVIPPNHSLSLH